MEVSKGFFSVIIVYIRNISPTIRLQLFSTNTDECLISFVLKKLIKYLRKLTHILLCI